VRIWAAERPKRNGRTKWVLWTRPENPETKCWTLSRTPNYFPFQGFIDQEWFFDSANFTISSHFRKISTFSKSRTFLSFFIVETFLVVYYSRNGKEFRCPGFGSVRSSVHNYDKVSKTTSDFGFGFRLFSAFFYSFRLFSHGAIKDLLRLFRFFFRLFFSTSYCTVINFLFLLKIPSIQKDKFCLTPWKPK